MPASTTPVASTPKGSPSNWPSALALKAGGRKPTGEQLEKLICQGVKSVTVHEVGHSLGLRHNFKASTLFTMDELNDPEKTPQRAGRLGDGLPADQPLAEGQASRATYFDARRSALMTTGRSSTATSRLSARKPSAELTKIASRGSEPSLQFATDEDADGFAPDPLTNRFDLSSDPAEFARRRVEVINQILPGILEGAVEPGEGYQHVRRAFRTLMAEHARVMGFVARYIGGSYEYRDHKGDPNGRPPFVVVEAKKQRDALALFDREVFGPEAYQIPTKLYNYLARAAGPTGASTRGPAGRGDSRVGAAMAGPGAQPYPRADHALAAAGLGDEGARRPGLLSGGRAAPGLTSAIFRETEKLQKGRFTNRTPAISSLRHSLQQNYFQRLADLALGEADAPSDCQTVARAELEALETRLKQVLAGKAKLDTYTHAHLSDLTARIRKVLDAAMELKVGGGKSSGG